MKRSTENDNQKLSTIGTLSFAETSNDFHEYEYTNTQAMNTFIHSSFIHLRFIQMEMNTN